GSGRPGAAARRHRPQRVLRVLLPVRSRHHDLRRNERDPAQPRRATRARPAALALRAHDLVGALPDLRLPSDLAAFRSDMRAFLVDAMVPARSAGHEDRTDLTGWDDAFE